MNTDKTRINAREFRESFLSFPCSFRVHPWLNFFLTDIFMKVGIAGFSGSGKRTAFHWLTCAAPDPAKAQQGQIGIPEIPDERLVWLSAHFKPKKTTPAKMEFLDTPGLLATERRDNPRRLGIMRDAGGLLVVLNGF